MGTHPCVYILASKRTGTLYTGVTGNLCHRGWQHKTGTIPGFTKKYGVDMLVCAEPHETMNSAITREKKIKEWKRKWKIELITGTNPDWRDLYDELSG